MITNSCYQNMVVLDFDAATASLYDNEVLKKVIALSDYYVVAVNVEFPLDEGIILATDNFWRVLGPDLGTEVIRGIREKYSCGKKLTKEEVFDINSMVQKYVM